MTGLNCSVILTQMFCAVGGGGSPSKTKLDVLSYIFPRRFETLLSYILLVSPVELTRVKQS